MREAFLTDASQGFNGEFWLCARKLCGFGRAQVTASNPVMRLTRGKYNVPNRCSLGPKGELCVDSHLAWRNDVSQVLG
ncbi:hypothetical protein C7476_10172 [Phyllobacterium bourgognense]|uniref:Uncharacterized protein n=1 Tax=Phyllobacterium bourgognense TaxID=314236 RepID=A0A368Z4H5_9HYPH|nr:hypothetical protein C7476_10172 [Phyllobacterium bourgognense]